MTTDIHPRSDQDASAQSDLSAPERAVISDVVVFLLFLGATLACALGLAAGLVAIAGASPGTVFSTMVEGSVGSRIALVATLNHTTPILIVAVGACVAFRAGLLNIGQEGQITVGALFGAAVGLALPFSGWFAILLILAASAAGGAAWALLPMFLRYGRGVSEVVTTLLLNFVAFQLVSYAVNATYLLQEDVPEGSVLSAQPQSNPLPDADRLPDLFPGLLDADLHLGILIAVAAAVIMAFVIGRTVWGFRLRVYGHNPRASRQAGSRPALIGGGALLVSAAFAGLAGGVLLTGVVGRIQAGFASVVYGSFSNNYGWQGLLVALVARFRPLYAIAAAFLFGALRAGSGVLSSTGIDSEIVFAVQALVVLAVAIPAVALEGRRRRRAAAARRERA